MPAQILTNESLTQQHSDLLAIPRTALPYSLILWVNDFSPDADTVLANLLEASFGGYHRVLLDPSLFQFTSPDGGCSHAQWGSTPYAWYVTADPIQTIYGWAVIDPLAGITIRVQRFDPTDILTIVLGSQFLLLPAFTLTSAVCEAYTDTPKGGIAVGGLVTEVYTPP